MGSISIREFIRWLPEEASEPTSTVVVTSPGHRFVDIRVIRPQDATGPWPTEEEKMSLGQLDWAIAGTSSSTPIGDGQITHGKWHHWIDSRTTETENVADEGDNYPQADGKTLEKGSMVNPATGKESEYEELWRDVEPLPVKSAGVKLAVLQLERGENKGSVVLLGQYCQGLLRKGCNITAERWEWTESGAWTRTVKIGHDDLPCSEILDQPLVECGNVIQVGDDLWKVVESSG